ncbi:hypothetical protein AWB69_08364 [Caballeronia udeis]|uniref:Uncharacterized protein n=1 Tax=Caballeronia udeis TaxID=1232866 RepID=A0A158JNP8_9BURK|nr:hypothetical protein AWB69_08364 [Caballeronia udeis]
MVNPLIIVFLFTEWIVCIKVDYVKIEMPAEEIA